MDKQPTTNHNVHTEMHSFFARTETDRSFFATKNRMPLKARLFRSAFKTVEKLSPPTAMRWGEKLFFTPRQRTLRKTDLEMLSKAVVHKIDFKGEELSVYAWGKRDAPAIVFAHGWGGRPTDFLSWILPLVQDGFRVVIPEAPGHGTSEKDRSSLPEMTEFFMQVVQDSGRVSGFIGHSLGGSVILLAYQKGLEIKPTILINNPSHPDGILHVFLSKINGSKSIGDYIKQSVKKEFGKSFYEFSSIHTAQSIPDIPMLIIHDRYDTEAPIYHFEAIRKVIPWSDFMITDNLGHSRILMNEMVIKKGMDFFEVHSF